MAKFIEHRGEFNGNTRLFVPWKLSDRWTSKIGAGVYVNR
jgi:hypothetical protein